MSSYFQFLDPHQDLSVAFLGSYNPALVMLSMGMATLASYVALKIVERITHSTSGAGYALWLISGSMAMGGGVWAMHFIGMLAFSLPCGVNYSPGITLISMVPGILASTTALWAISKKDVSVSNLTTGSVLMGLGVASMHYSGMAAMRIDGIIYYSPLLFSISIIVAVMLAAGAIFVKFAAHRLTSRFNENVGLVLAAGLMGLAISGMHYVAMEAAYFLPLNDAPPIQETLSPSILAVGVTLVVASLMAALFAVSARARLLETIAVLKASEDALLIAENRFVISQNFANIGTWEWTIQSGELYWSDKIAPLFGGINGQLETSYDNFLSAIHPDDRDMVTDAIQACVENRRHYDVEHRVVWPDGTIRWLHETGDAERDRNGNAMRMLGIVRDVTDRKEAQDAMLLAKVFAEKASRAKSEFLSTMSHELRTPLNAILGFAQMLGFNPKEPLTENQKTSIAVILNSGDKLLSLIDQLLELNRIEDGEMTVSIDHVPSRGIIDKSLALIRARAEQEGIQITDQTTEDALPLVRTDETRAIQVLLIMLSNAVKYIDEGGTVTISALELPGRWLRINVVDIGWGISEEKQAHLFEPFERLGLEAGPIEGAGVGLTIAKHLTDLLGARIGFKSTKGEGSTFWLDLPIQDDT